MIIRKTQIAIVFAIVGLATGICIKSAQTHPTLANAGVRVVVDAGHRACVKCFNLGYGVTDFCMNLVC